MNKKLILDFLEDTCKKFPNKTAFADPETSLTFSELVAQSKIIGSNLAEYVKTGSVIPFYLDKCTLAISGFMGAVYAGCAYAPLNLRFPAARIQKLLETINSPIVITDKKHFEALKNITDLKIIILEDILSCQPNENILKQRRAELVDIYPLYVSFTSGSTGNPKGVVESHKNIVDFIKDFTECFNVNENDVFANQAPFDFDASVKDIYSGIFTGARVEIIPTSYFIDPVKLMDFLCDREVTIMVWAVSALCFLTTMNALQYKTPDKVRGILFSGEVMPVKHLKKLKKFLPDVMYVNLYGPTEITCNCTYYILDRDFNDAETIPIGKPFKNKKVFLLDENNNEVTEKGMTGELCVSGSSVALGYLNNFEKTQENFTQNPLNKSWHERIYRTGDIIKISENGEWIYVSRKDFQIKHMGHRIELTEIDTAINSLPGIDRACCQYIKEKGKIIAFVSGDFDRSNINSLLLKILPEYMLPNLYFQVERMPLNKNGKIDRQALMDLYINRKEKSK